MRQSVRMIVLSIIICTLGFSTPVAAGDDAEAEKAIKQTLFDYAKAWNKKDVKGVIAWYHDDADIMTGKDKKMVFQIQYEKILP